MTLSVELAKTARDEVGGDGWVAASVGPYGAALANGEEYVGRYGLSVKQLADWHRPRLEVLVDAEPDVLAIETVPDIDEAQAVVALVHRARHSRRGCPTRSTGQPPAPGSLWPTRSPSPPMCRKSLRWA